MHREFKGVWIPAEVWLDDRLTLVEKALLAEIDSFCGNGKSFRKTNQTIQDEYGISRPTITRAIKKLQELGFVDITFDGRIRNILLHAGCSKFSRRQKEMSRQGVKNDHAARSNKSATNTRERTKKNTTKNKEIILPFEGEDFARAWETWREYKRDEHGFKFKSAASESAALHQLQNLSGGDVSVAIRIIGQSVANGWKGFFTLKNSRNENDRLGPADGSLIAEHLRRLANDSGESLG